MASAQLTSVVRHIHQLVGMSDNPEQSDARLLQRFLADRDESAFRRLVERHGRMVLSVCRNILRQQQDAEDAFQATFLVLARKAGSIREGTALASWLYGVAYRTSLKARSRLSQRQRYERRAAQMVQSAPDLDLALRELQAILADEVNRLPEKYRAPFVLCCLEGKSRSEAAAQLGWKKGTVFGRVAEARKRLQQRLARRGVTLAAALCASAVGAGAQAAASPVLVRTTIKAALGIAAGQSAPGVASAPVAALVEGVTQTMFVNKVKLASILLVAAGFLAAGAGIRIHSAFAAPAAGESASTLMPQTADKPAKRGAEKAPENKDGKVVVHGRVLDPDGKPLAGARVFLPAAERGDAKKGSVVDVKSGEDGRFHFTIDRAQLVPGRSLAATAKGYALAWIEADKLDKGEITLRLVKDMPIKGRVLDLEGRPIKGVRVSVRRVAASAEDDLTPVLKSIHRDGNRVFHHPLRVFYMGTEVPLAAPVTTDDAGRFRFSGLGQERLVVLWVEGPTIEHQVLYVLTRPELNVKELIQSAPDLLRIPGRGKTPLPAMYGPTFDHTASPTKPIEGVVRDKATGKPLADVWVNGSASELGWWENGIRVKTDPEGHYRLIGLPKSRTFRIWVYAAEQDYLSATKSIGDSPGLGAIALDFELVRGIRVKGRITDKQTGQPVRASLGYVPLAGNKYFRKIPGNDYYRGSSEAHWTEKDGSFSLLALPGSGLIKVRAEVGGENPYTQAVIAHEDEPKAYSVKDEGLGQSFLSAGNVIEFLMGHNAYRLIDPDPDAKSVTCNIQLDRGQTRSGTVVDPDGKPLTGVRAFGLVASGGGKTLADSTFKAVSLNSTKPRLIAFMHKERKLVGHVLLSADAKEPVTVRLQPGAVLTGRLLDEDGKPLAGITVSVGYYVNVVGQLAGEVSAEQPVKTDAEGRFRLEGIFPGLKCSLSLRAGRRFLVTDRQYQGMTLEAGTKELGDITAKPFRPE